MAIRKRTWKTKTGEAKTAWVVDYKDQDGGRRLKTFSRKKDADAWAIAAGHQVQQGTHTPDSLSITVAKACDLWLERCVAEKLERSTLDSYRAHVDLHIKPSSLGNVKLSQLNTPMVEDFKTRLEADKGKPLAHAVLVSLKSVLKTAQRKGRIAQNVAQPVTVRKAKRKATRPEIGVNVPSKDEVRQLIEHAEGRWRPLFITAIFCGLRSSELRGLRWHNVGFDAKVIRVRERADAWNQHGEPKSEAGNRDVPMTPMVANTLKEWKLACPKGELGLVFPNGKGKHESHANIYNRGLVPLQMQTGMVDADGKPKYTMHCLRHFCASWLIGQGFMPKRVQTIMGHQSIQMTFDVYGHWLEQEDEQERMATAEDSVMKPVTG